MHIWINEFKKWDQKKKAHLTVRLEGIISKCGGD
jgi:hypothetical protein